MKYFIMSRKFDKQSPSSFELEYSNGKFISLKDGSEWVQCHLYDYGWGKENGFYKKPLGSFNELINLLLILLMMRIHMGLLLLLKIYILMI